MSVSQIPFWRVVPSQTGREQAYTLPIMLPATVGPEGAGHLMGGVAMAAIIDAMELESGQQLLWANLQFLSPTQHVEELQITTAQCGGGQSIGQWMAEAHVNGRPTHRLSASLGAREPCEGEVFTVMPDLPGPDQCAPQEGLRFGAPGSLQDQIELRVAANDPKTGYTATWIKSTAGFANDAAWLAIIADFFLGGHPRSAGGSSLDATFRFIQPAPAGWVLSVTQYVAVDRGVIHGCTQHFSEDGKVLAISSQTGVLPRIAKS